MLNSLPVVAVCSQLPLAPAHPPEPGTPSGGWWAFFGGAPVRLEALLNLETFSESMDLSGPLGCTVSYCQGTASPWPKSP